MFTVHAYGIALGPHGGSGARDATETRDVYFTVWNMESMEREGWLHFRRAGSMSSSSSEVSCTPLSSSGTWWRHTSLGAPLRHAAGQNAPTLYIQCYMVRCWFALPQAHTL